MFREKKKRKKINTYTHIKNNHGKACTRSDHALEGVCVSAVKTAKGSVAMARKSADS
jgi:hypothetical protein